MVESNSMRHVYALKTASGSSQPARAGTSCRLGILPAGSSGFQPRFPMPVHPVHHVHSVHLSQPAKRTHFASPTQRPFLLSAPSKRLFPRILCRYSENSPKHLSLIHLQLESERRPSSLIVPNQACGVVKQGKTRYFLFPTSLHPRPSAVNSPQFLFTFGD